LSEGRGTASACPPGAERMSGAIERQGPYRRVWGTRRFVAEVVRE
jgi:hypothetical protein